MSIPLKPILYPGRRQYGLRLAVTAPADDDELAEGLRRLKAMLDDWRP
ncbi:hypothetical protein [Megasphaera sp. An286]|nr:hypothetical protein [Megasphaera sp. An286]